jgi:hypothetical protein
LSVGVNACLQQLWPKSCAQGLQFSIAEESEEGLMNFDQWNGWKRAVVVNALGAVSGAVGFASAGVKLSPQYCVPIAVFALAYLNLMFLIVLPRSLAAKAGGKPRVAALTLLVDVVQERPLLVLLVVLQLVGVSRSATAAVTFFQLSGGEYVRGLPNASAVGFRMVAMSVVMTVVAGVWLASAIGLWNRRSWAWWLALMLNGLAASVTGVLQLLDWHSYLLDSRAITAVVLLLLPTVRRTVLAASDATRSVHTPVNC